MLRVAQLAFFIFAGLVVLAAALLFLFQARTIELLQTERAAALESELHARAALIAAAPATLSSGAAMREQPASSYLLVDSAGERLFGTADSWPAVVLRDGHIFSGDLETRGRMQSDSLMMATSLPDGRRLLVARDGSESDPLLRSFGFLFALATLVAAIVALGVALVVVRRLDSSIYRIGAEALGRLSGGREGGALAARAGLLTRPAASVVDTLLGAADEQKKNTRLVLDLVAHDLKSPMSRLRNRLEDAAGRGGEEALRSALAGAARDADSVIKLLSTLLEIGQAEGGAGSARFESVDLSIILGEIAELYEPLAEASGRELVLDVQPWTFACVQPDLITRAIGNLVENALKHAWPGKVVIFARRMPDHVACGVEDPGPGIAPEHQQRALQRFSRIPRGDGAEGWGLGLALVNSIVRLHRGEISFVQLEERFRTTLLLPLH
ncbi:MAG TPA: HAMP domain-containing sensor histidine kinase [Allosphingosinicella sp.]